MPACSSDVRLLDVWPKQGTCCCNYGTREQQQVACSDSHFRPCAGSLLHLLHHPLSLDKATRSGDMVSMSTKSVVL
jgi:hypothetical protein